MRLSIICLLLVWSSATVQSQRAVARLEPAKDPGAPLRIPPKVAEGLLCGSAHPSGNVHHLEQMCGPVPPPLYPAEAKKQGIQGPVHLRAKIGEDGLIKDLKVIDGHPMLTAAAIEAVKRWTYRPYLLNGTPVAFETTITVNFELVRN